MERSTLKAVIDLVDVNQLVYLSRLSEDRAVEESMALFSSYGTYIKTQKSNLLQKLFLQSAYIQEKYTALVVMGITWTMVTPSAEDRQTHDGTPYKWSDYMQKISSILLTRHGHAERISL